MYNYIGIINKSSSVSNSIVCNFLNNQTKLNLILSKSNLIEIYDISKDGLIPNPYLNIYGNIVLLEKIKNSDFSDNLFVLTEDLDFCILSHNKLKNEIICIDKGSIKEDIGKKLDKVYSSFEKNSEYVILSAYKNIFKIVFLKNRINNNDYTMRYEYDDSLFLFPLHSDSDKLNIQYFGFIKAITNYSDNKSIYLDLFMPIINKQEFKDIDKLDLSFNPTISLIFSPKIGGIVIFFSNYLKYYVYNNKLIEKETRTYTDRRFNSYSEIDSNRYLIGDEFGDIYLLAFKNNNFIFQFLGQVNYINTLTYIDNNFVFIGSDKSNSQLVRIVKENTNIQNRPFIDIIEEYDNLAPVSDFVVFNNAEESNTEMLCISGVDLSCSLKTIRKGTSIDIYGELERYGLKTVFPIKCYLKDTMQIDEYEPCRILIISSYIDRTEVFQYEEKENTIIECEKNISDFFLNELTLLATNISLNNENYILIITTNMITLFDNDMKIIKQINIIIPPIIVKIKKKNLQLYIYNQNNTFLRFNLKKILCETNINPEILIENFLISAFDVTDNIIIFSTWNSNKIHIYNLNNRKIELLCEFNPNVFANSIAFIKNDGIKFLFIALSDGKMLFYKLKPSIAKNIPSYTYTHDDFILKRKYNISNETFDLKRIKSNNKNYLFINTELPSLLYLQKESPNISNFNIKECNDIVNLSRDLYIFIFKNQMCIGSLSSSQSQNIITKHVKKQINNLNLINGLNILSYIEEEKKRNKLIYSLVIIDNHLNEINRYTIDHENEVCISFIEIKNKENKQRLFALGTGISEDNNEPQRGYIYLLSLNENLKINKIFETEIKGGVYKMANIDNLLFVAIASTLHIYKIINNELKHLRKYSDFTIINDLLCHDKFILVSDIYKSITIFTYDEEKDKLIECCRDNSPIWCYSMEKIEHNMYLVSDIDGNIFVLRRENIPKNDEDKYKLERVAQFNLGERINKIINLKKSINSKDYCNIYGNKGDETAFSMNISYFGTLEGSIGVIINIPKDLYDYLFAIQTKIIEVISSTGNFDYDRWRSFKDGFISDKSKGFIEGSLIQEFLNFDERYRVEFLKSLNYPWTKNLSDTISIIESLIKYH